MNKIKFFVRFVAVLTILFIAWIPFAETFAAIKYGVIGFFFKLISDDELVLLTPPYVVGAMTNIVTFTALVLATLNITIKRRIKVIIFGVVILFFLEVFTMNAYLLFEGGSGIKIEGFMHSIGMVFFPIVLWLVMLYGEIFPKKVEQKEKSYIKVMKEMYHGGSKQGVPKEESKCPLCKKEQENVIEHLKSKHGNKMRNRKVKEFLKKHPELKA